MGFDEIMDKLMTADQGSGDYGIAIIELQALVEPLIDCEVGTQELIEFLENRSYTLEMDIYSLAVDCDNKFCEDET